jgi:hypothetical protein
MSTHPKPSTYPDRKDEPSIPLTSAIFINHGNKINKNIDNRGKKIKKIKIGLL